MSYYNLAALYLDIFAKNRDKQALCYSRNSNVNSTSYNELGSLANRLAHFLCNEVGKRGEVVAILNDKSPTGFACMLAAIQNGMPYVNLDPYSPVSRIEKIFEFCRPSVLFYADQFTALAYELKQHPLVKIDYNSEDFLIKLGSCAEKPLFNIETLTGESPAYIMFTSGSTGFPKGAVMTHGNVLNLIEWTRYRYKLKGNEIFTNVNPLYFDNSVFDFYGSIFNGIALAPFTTDETRQAKKLILSIEELRCTHWFSVPSLLVYILRMKAFLRDSIPCLNTLSFGGEVFPKTLLRKLHELYPQKKLINVYGPTECSCICSSYDVESKDMESSSLLPLGLINPNFDYLILDENDMEVSKGEIGNLFLLGPCVGKGYYNNKEKTIEVFIQNPMNHSYPEIGYKTGDLVWENSETGLLHFRSRKDYQIKHMGYRIELQEIESILAGLPNVGECAVLYHKRREATAGNIIAYVAAEKGIVEATSIIDQLRNELPYYMIPSDVIITDFLPKNANGKIDRFTLSNS